MRMKSALGRTLSCSMVQSNCQDFSNWTSGVELAPHVTDLQQGGCRVHPCICLFVFGPKAHELGGIHKKISDRLCSTSEVIQESYNERILLG
jgi:hypothetical protein